MQLFISHSSKDAILAVRLQESLAKIGYESSFLDIDAHQGLRAGDEWRDRLFNAIAECAAVVYVGTDNSHGSRWCHTELALARWLHKPVIPLAFGTSVPHEVIADIHAVRVADGADLASVLRDSLAPLALQTTESWDPTRSPFPGLRSFVEDEAAVFFGRDALIEDLRRLVDPPSRPAQGVVIPVLGPSGSGKSSLVRAGFIPRLRKDPTWVVIDPFTPRDAPLDELAVAMHLCARGRGVAVDVAECRRLAVSPNGLLEFGRRLRMSEPSEQSGLAPRLLVVIDQGEELLTTTSEQRRNEFLEGLAVNCQAPADLAVIMTARTDLWDRIDSGPLHAYTATTVLHVAPFDRSNLVRVIEQPARMALVEFEPGLVERLVDDTGTGLALPFLAFVLNKMSANTKRVGGRLVLTHAAYDATGGVQGGIAQQARSMVDPTRDEAGMAASVLPLVSLSGPDPSARRVRSNELTDTQRADLDRLAEARLVVVEGEGDERTYAATHDALLSAWEPLASLIRSRQDDLRMRDRLDRQAADWEAGGRGRSGLLEGSALAAAEVWNGRSHDLATTSTEAYITESGRQLRRRRVVRIAAMAVVAVLAIALVGVLVSGARAADKRAVEARASELVAIANSAAANDPVLAAIALAEAYDIQPSTDDFVESAQALLKAPVRDVWSVQDGIGALGFVAAGEVGVSAGPTSGTNVWDLATGRRIHNVKDAQVVAIRPDGRVIAANKGRDIELVDVGFETPEPELLATVAGTRAAFSRDGSLMAVVMGDTTWVGLWDVSDPSQPVQVVAWPVGAGGVYDVAFAADGRVLTLTADAALREWDQDGALVSTVDGALLPPVQPTSPVTGYLGSDQTARRVMVSGAGLGEIAAIVDLDADPPTAQRVKPVNGLDDASSAINPTWGSTFDSEGKMFVSFSLANNGTVRDAQSGKEITPLDGHRGLVMRTVMPDESTIVSTGLDNTVRMWTARPPTPSGDASELREALCAEFGPRMTVERRDTIPRLDAGGELPCAVEKRVVTDAPLQLARTSALPRLEEPTNVVMDEAFDSPDGWIESSTDDVNGKTNSVVANGEYAVSVALTVSNFTYWYPVAAPSVGSTYAVSADVRRDSGDGVCGISVGAGDATLVISADPSSDEVAIRLLKPDANGSLQPYEFGRVPADMGTEATIGMTVDDGIGTVLVDGVPVVRLGLPEFATPAQVGAAVTGGTADCVFDDYVVSGV